MTPLRLQPNPARRFPDEAFEVLDAAASRHFWFQSRNRLILWALERHFPPPSRVFEVGCGGGIVLEAIGRRYPTVELVGGDASDEALRVAEARLVSAQLVQVDATVLPFREEFDVVFALDVLEHLDDDRKALHALAQATRPGGGIVVTVPQYRWLWSPADDYGGHRRRYTKLEIEKKMHEAGFTVLRSTAWMALLLPVVAVSRLRDRWSRGAYDPNRELDIPPAANSAFRLALDVERRVIAHGVNLPVGTSRLVIGRKP
jgi:trans-aconitate methyltransferase